MARSRTGEFGRLAARCFGTVLREYRIAAHMTQDALADEADIHRRYVQLLETGNSQPTLEILLRLSYALNVEFSVVLARTEALIIKEMAGGKRAGSARGGRRNV